MIGDARSLPRDAVVTSDVCIVGAGAAGITLARELAGKAIRVCVLESGGFDPDEATQGLYEGQNVGVPQLSLEASRARYFGGTTNWWTGNCRPLDGIDFETRDWIPHSGWPFGRDELDPFYARSQIICQLGRYAYGAGAWEDQESAPRLPFVGDRIVTTMFQISAPTRFGAIYRQELERAENVQVYLYANVLGIDTDDSARQARHAKVACLNGNRFRVAARIFILASGGIENARLLLLSDSVNPRGLGNDHDLVGRFFMEHLWIKAGPLVFSDPRTPVALYGAGYSRKAKGAPAGGLQGVVALSEKALRRERLANFCALLFPIEDPRGVRALRLLAGSARRARMPDNFWRSVADVIRDLDNVASAMYRRTTMGTMATGAYVVWTRSEQIPNAESRVTLSNEIDSLGKRRAQLRWVLSPLDLRTIERGLDILGEAVGQAGLGRLRSAPYEPGKTVGESIGDHHHHMGTTRMHADPRQGVVNENCRVHGVSNLYVAGSSVFPTGGYANPTLTIVALALRLTDHVRARLQAGGT